jgi:hypothetical protein
MARAFDLVAALPEDLTLLGRGKNKPRKRRNWKFENRNSKIENRKAKREAGHDLSCPYTPIGIYCLRASFMGKSVGDSGGVSAMASSSG